MFEHAGNGIVIKEAYQEEERGDGQLGDCPTIRDRTDHSYIDNEDLHAFDIGLFTVYFKDEQEKVWTITLVPK